VKRPSLKISGINSWYQTRKQKRKEKEEMERHLESSALKMVTFFFTAIAMGVGMSVLPLFPQPLPIFLAILVAFITFNSRGGCQLAVSSSV
jgi:type III secretory pathway component EscV